MRLLRAFVTIVVVGVSAGAQAPNIDKILADIRAKDTGQLAVSEEDGRFLRVLVASSGRKREGIPSALDSAERLDSASVARRSTAAAVGRRAASRSSMRPTRASNERGRSGRRELGTGSGSKRRQPSAKTSVF